VSGFLLYGLRCNSRRLLHSSHSTLHRQVRSELGRDARTLLRFGRTYGWLDGFLAPVFEVVRCSSCNLFRPVRRETCCTVPR